MKKTFLILSAFAVALLSGCTSTNDQGVTVSKGWLTQVEQSLQDANV